MSRLTSAASFAVTIALALAACGGSDDDDRDSGPAAPVSVGDTILLTTSGRLASINRAAPGTLVGSVQVSGLASGESLLGIDYRPADGQLYALGSSGRIYTVQPSTGVATQKAVLRAAAGDDNPFSVLSGADFAVDFNPVADRLRVVSNAGQNLRINVDTGDTITDGTITSSAGAASVTAAAYTNSLPGASTTALYDIDGVSGRLQLQDPPNSGTLAAGASLGVAASSVNGFDIDARNNRGFAAFSSGGSATLYSINLAAASGAATRIGDIALAEPIRGLAVVQPAPTVVGLTGDNRLVAFDPKTPNVLSSNLPVTGLGSGERLVGIDVRPADGILHGLTGAGRIYTIDFRSGAATLKSTLTPDGTDTTAPFAALSGSSFSVDFNPVADRLRVISETGQSLRINVDTGAVTTDGAINRPSGTPNVVAAAYGSSFSGTTSTILFDLEANSDVLARQDPPNNGTLVDVGPLGIDVTTGAAFDIAGGADGLALSALRQGAAGPSSLYGVSLATGAASLFRVGDPALSAIGGPSGPAVIDIAILF